MIKYLLLFSVVLSPSLLSAQYVNDSEILTLQAPPSFRATVETTKGAFVIEAYREWSPDGVDRLYQLLCTHFYDSNALFRVQKGYVVQFGIGDIQDVNRFWDQHPIPDEPVQQQNLRGTISYARDGANSRTAQLFINGNDNLKLDTVLFNNLLGFPPIARIIEGYDVIDQLYSEYGFEPANHQDSAMRYGNSYWRANFPNLDYIISARINQ